MAMDNWQKVKVLKLAELLRQETDEEHPLTTAQLCGKMKAMGTPCDRRVLSKDVDLLNAQGIKVLWKWFGKAKGYYVEDRSFSVSDLKILSDAVQAAGFITEKKTDELIGKIAALGGTHRADILEDNIICLNTRKCCNEDVCANVEVLEAALRKRKKVIFRYFDLDADGERIYRWDGHYFMAEPVALVFDDGGYYAVACSGLKKSAASYQVDRMDGVEVVDEEISEKAMLLYDDIGAYAQEALEIYGGSFENVF